MDERSPLYDLYIGQMKDIYNAEQQISRVLPEWTDLTSRSDLRQALEDHAEETRRHATRIERILGGLNLDPTGAVCTAMEGILREGQELVRKQRDPAARDAAVIAAMQRVEHYEMAAYGTVQAYADELGYEHAADLLAESLEEEEDSGQALSELAVGILFRPGVNVAARGA